MSTHMEVVTVKIFESSPATKEHPDPDCKLPPAEIVFGHPIRDAFFFVYE